MNECFILWQQYPSEQISPNTHIPYGVTNPSVPTQLSYMSFLCYELSVFCKQLCLVYLSGLVLIYQFCSLMRAVICFLLYCCICVSTVPWVAAVILPSGCQGILFTF